MRRKGETRKWVGEKREVRVHYGIKIIKDGKRGKDVGIFFGREVGTNYE